MWPVPVTLCVSARHSMLSMYQLSTPLVPPVHPTLGQLEAESGPARPTPRPQDHWQVQSVGSCTM